MIKTLVHWDKELFLFLNSFHSIYLDKLMTFVSSYTCWVILFILLGIALFYYNKSIKELLLYIGSTATAIAVANLVKLFVERPRPIHYKEWEGIIHNIDKYSDHYSFFSSHAASAFCFAFFVFLSLPKHRWIGYLSMLLVAIISYSRIYVGKHFPLDVFVGMLAGIVIASLGVYLNKRYSK